MVAIGLGCSGLSEIGFSTTSSGTSFGRLFLLLQLNTVSVKDDVAPQFSLKFLTHTISSPYFAFGLGDRAG